MLGNSRRACSDTYTCCASDCAGETPALLGDSYRLLLIAKRNHGVHTRSLASGKVSGR